MTREHDRPPLRVGIVGAGSWASSSHIPGFQRCLDAQIVAICDIDVDRVQRVAEVSSIPHVYPSAAAMLAAEKCDVVSVVTPDDCHRADVEAALAAGAHVLCEKPLATTLADAQALADAARAADRRTAMGFGLRYAPAMQRLKRLIAAGEIGEPRLLQAFQQNGQFLDPAKPHHWKMRSERTGGGAVVEYGIHTIDIARWLLGEVDRVCALARTWVPERPLPDGSGSAVVDTDDSTAWLMAFASGATGVCHAGWSTVGRPPGLEVRVFGSSGAIHCVLSDDLPGAEGLWQAGPDGHLQPIEAPARLADPAIADDPWWVQWPARLIRDFVTELDAEQPTVPTFDDGLHAQAILQALLTSTHERRWVEVPHVRVG